MMSDVEEVRYPKLGDTLINESGGKRAKVLFADWMAGKWDHYADGYKLAADRLVDQIQGEPWDDVLIFPIIFLYRHFVELKLKDLVMNLEQLSGKCMKGKFDHPLPGLWLFIQTQLTCLRDAQWENEMLPALGVLISELSALDPNSMHSRYPTDKQLRQLAIPRAVSTSHLKTMMEAVRNGLGYIEAGIEIEIARRIDA